jgi:large conductance mechanosensitive channel
MDKHGIELTPKDFPTQIGNPSSLFRPRKRGANMLNEFREFALRGSMIDLAIGIVMGVAFGRVVASLVEDVMMPPIGLLLGRADASGLFINLSGTHYATLAAAKAAGAPTINLGLFFNTVLNFLIVAAAVFLLVRSINRLKRAQAEAPSVPETKTCPFCCSVIPAAATRCGHCTATLAEAASSSS